MVAMKSGYDARPIGIFDSGVGGLTVLRAIARRLPQERFLYLGDTARVPYGTKSARTVERYTTQVASLLLRRGVKALVVACNTASAMGLAALRAHCRTPVLGVIQPGCRAAVAALEEKTATGEGAAVGVGVIGTHSTVASGMYPHTLALLAPHIQITSLACPLFVPLVEEGWINRPATRLIVEESLQPLTNAGIGILMLAALSLMGHTDIHRMNGLKNLLATCINGVSATYFVYAGLVIWSDALVMALGAVVGGVAGASLARRIGRTAVQRTVVVVGFVMALALMARL